VILGSENFPKEIGFRWPMVERLPYVIGDFTWTAWDYLGEAGIGKAVYVDQDDPIVKTNGWALMPPSGSPYPWRCANDADFDITGHMMPQGAYRSVVWGDKKTHVFSYHPETFGKTEVMTMWGFPLVQDSWNYEGWEKKNIRLIVFSNAEEVELLVNGKSLGKRKVSMERPMPYSAIFDTVYEKGEVVAISYADGKEISRDSVKTTGKPCGIRLLPENKCLRANGHDLAYVGVEIIDQDGNVVPDAEIDLSAEVTGCVSLAGFGSANPRTEDNYTDGETKSFRGRAMAIIRSSFETGNATLTISAKEKDGREICSEQMPLDVV
jgi:beta-galactosidase